MFYAYDGDKVGKKLESLLIDNDESAIEEYAHEVLCALHKLEESLKLSGCKIIFASGDSVMAKSDIEIDVEAIAREYADITFSLGVGESPLEAMLALKKSKSKGIAQFSVYKLSRAVE